MVYPPRKFPNGKRTGRGLGYLWVNDDDHEYVYQELYYDDVFFADIHHENGVDALTVDLRRYSPPEWSGVIYSMALADLKLGLQRIVMRYEDSYPIERSYETLADPAQAARLNIGWIESDRHDQPVLEVTLDGKRLVLVSQDKGVDLARVEVPDQLTPAETVAREIPLDLFWQALLQAEQKLGNLASPTSDSPQ